MIGLHYKRKAFRMKKAMFCGLVSVLMGIVSGCQSGTERPEVARIVKQIGTAYTPFPVGYEGRITHQDDRIDELRRVATLDELYQLATADSVPMVRLAAFIAIMKQRPSIAKTIALMDIQSQACVPTLYGCSEYMESLAALRIAFLQKNRHYGLSKADSVAIDSCVLFTLHAKHLDYLRYLLCRLPPHRQYYERVKALFLRHHYIEALVALARYRRPEDCQYVLDALQGKVKDPINAAAYWAEYEHIHTPRLTLSEKITRWLHPKRTVEDIPEPRLRFDLHAHWQYIPEEDDYNDAEMVRKYALRCVYENPNVPAFKPYLQAAQAYRRRQMCDVVN